MASRGDFERLPLIDVSGLESADLAARRTTAAELDRAPRNSGFTPEFGPDGYLQQAPFSKRPVADLGELNRWMAARQRAKLGELL